MCGSCGLAWSHSIQIFWLFFCGVTHPPFNLGLCALFFLSASDCRLRATGRPFRRYHAFFHMHLPGFNFFNLNLCFYLVFFSFRFFSVSYSGSVVTARGRKYLGK